MAGKMISDTGIERLNRLARRVPPTKLGRGDWQSDFPQAIRILFRITAVRTWISGARWRYGWEEVYIDGSDDAQALTAGGSGDYSDVEGEENDTHAINLNELNHVEEPEAEDPWILSGVDAHGDDYPAGFSLQPIPVGSVMAGWLETRNDGSTRLVFDRVNAHDGTCEEPA
jgi:hypothetical protein